MIFDSFPPIISCAYLPKVDYARLIIIDDCIPDAAIVKIDFFAFLISLRTFRFSAGKRSLRYPSPVRICEGVQAIRGPRRAQTTSPTLLSWFHIQRNELLRRLNDQWALCVIPDVFGDDFPDSGLLHRGEVLDSILKNQQIVRPMYDESSFFPLAKSPWCFLIFVEAPWLFQIQPTF